MVLPNLSSSEPLTRTAGCVTALCQLLIIFLSKGQQLPAAAGARHFFDLVKASKEVGAIGKVRLPKFHFYFSVLSLIGLRLLLIMPQMDKIF